jgi:hypothetical protein
VKQARAKGQHGCKPSFLARGSASCYCRWRLIRYGAASAGADWCLSGRQAGRHPLPLRSTTSGYKYAYQAQACFRLCTVVDHILRVVLSPMCGGELEWRQTSDTAGRLPGETSLESRQGNSSRQSHQQDASTCFRTPYLLRCTVRLELRLYKCWGWRKTHHPCLTPEVASAGRRVARYVHVPGS